jgi:hypothetical protein
MSDYDAEIETFIRDAFEKNYELLRLEGAGALAPDARDTALQQVLLYWRKMRDVAESVTHTEVKLSLPGQKTPQGREFAITGVVDIVRDNERTVMYDIKTHDAQYVRDNEPLYRQQLNVYAHIWQELRGEPLDETAVIATDYPPDVKEALLSLDQAKIDHELQKWEPLIPITFDRSSVQATIDEFATTVDAIEDGDFAPPPAEKLREQRGSKTLFATRICRNCDARFSCSSYRRYALQGRGQTDHDFRRYFNDLGPDLDQENWRTANLNAARDIGELARDFTR